MFNRAYVRGVQNAMVQAGHASFPSEENAAKVADYIADRIPFDSSTGPVPRETTAKIAEHIVDASQWYTKQADYVPGVFYKLASTDDLNKLAHAHALDVMQKAAEGSTIEGGDKGNKSPESAEAKMDAANRPAGYAENSQGSTAVDTKPGAVGKEQEQPAKPAETPAGTNSVIEQSKTSSLASLIAKIATGSNFMGGDKGNATPTTAEGKMDLTQRPHGYASLPHQGAPGAIPAMIGGSAVVGKETPHPNAPGEHPAGTNSVVQHSAKAASADPYMALFSKVAAEVVQFLPGGINEESKIAHVRACMGMTMEEKATYLVGLQKEAADASATEPTQHAPASKRYNGLTANQKQAGEGGLPAFIQEKIDAKKDGDKGEDKGEKSESKSEEKKEEKSEEKEKAASMLEHIRRISSAVNV